MQTKYSNALTKSLLMVFVILLPKTVNMALADCDRAGMCRKLVRMIEQDIEACQSNDNCMRPGVVDCFNDMAIFNTFSCNAADCIYVQAKLQSGIGATMSTCNALFPQIVGTKFERSPFGGQQSALGEKTSPHGLFGVGGH